MTHSKNEDHGNAPRPSVQPFIPPQAGAVKKSPLVKDVVKDPVSPPAEEEKPTPSPEVVSSPAPLAPEADRKPVEQETSSREPEEEPLDFAGHWMKIADLFFDKMPTVYYSIKEHIPQKEGERVLIRIKNPLQKESIERKIPEILDYLRQHFDPALEAVEVWVDEALETKTKLLNSKDQLAALTQENGDLPDFLNLLNLHLKD